MEVSYYPGCSLHSMAEEYDESLRAVCQRLGVKLCELDDWNCCGASSAHFFDEQLALDLAARNVQIADRAGRNLLVPCAACFQRLKAASKWMRPADEEQHEAPSAKRQSAPSGSRCETIYHVNEFFEQPHLLGRLQGLVCKPLRGLAGVAYYGCLSQRPPRVTDAPAAENPTAMDRLMETIGMQVRSWSYKTDCCGASLALSRPELVRKLSGDLFAAAQEAGAECIVTDCPMCQTNLDSRQVEIEAERKTRFNMPVFYITELIALAMGDLQAGSWWKKHFVDPVPLLQSKGLL